MTDELTPQLICALAGVPFRGIQEGVPSLNLHAQVLFDAPSGSTLCLPEGEISVRAIERKLVEHSRKSLPHIPQKEDQWTR